MTLVPAVPTRPQPACALHSSPLPNPPSLRASLLLYFLLKCSLEPQRPVQQPRLHVHCLWRYFQRRSKPGHGDPSPPAPHKKVQQPECSEVPGLRALPHGHILIPKMRQTLLTSARREGHMHLGSPGIRSPLTTDKSLDNSALNEIVVYFSQVQFQRLAV